MKYAVIAISGSQYIVKEKDTITVDLQKDNEGEIKSTDQILLAVEDGKVKIGNPLVKDAQVEFKILKNYQGKKLRIFKYKAKSRYRKTQGFRAQLTDIEITKINI